MSHSRLWHTTHWMLAVIAAASIMCACHVVPEQSKFLNVGAEGWIYGQSLYFKPEPPSLTEDEDTMAITDIAVAIRHSNGYEYSNIWVELTYQGQDTIQTDTFNIRLADQFGRWHGNGVGVGYQMVDTVLRGTVLDRRHPISIRHIMRTDTLKDIEQVGLILDYK